MKKISMGLLFGALTGMSQTGFAALTGTDTVTIDFPKTLMDAAAYGYGANETPIAGGDCPVTGGAPCYKEDGFVIGSPADGNVTNHIHRAAGANLNDRSLAYHSDSSGIYLRAQDESAFNLKSIDFHAEISPDNYIYGSAMDMNNPISDQQSDIGLLGPEERWEIFGFSSAVNPSINADDGYASAVAYASVANGFTGTIGTDAGSDFLLGEVFKNVSAIWIHYNGYPSTPVDGITFAMHADNIMLGAAAVPVPAAVWMFGSGLLGLISFGRKKSSLTA